MRGLTGDEIAGKWLGEVVVEILSADTTGRAERAALAVP